MDNAESFAEQMRRTSGKPDNTERVRKDYMMFLQNTLKNDLVRFYRKNETEYNGYLAMSDTGFGGFTLFYREKDKKQINLWGLVEEYLPMIEEMTEDYLKKLGYTRFSLDYDIEPVYEWTETFFSRKYKQIRQVKVMHISISL